jgi:predicted DNA-binding transcriptional regulator AlpA
MAKRKPDPSLAGQLDMFGQWQSSTNQQIPTTLPTPQTVEPANVDKAQIRQAPNLPSPANDVSELANPATCHLFNETVDTTLVTCPMIQAESQNLMIPQQRPIGAPAWLTDEWWTTSMVCSFLKLGRKAIWERQRHPDLAFPQAFHFGSMRHRWRSEEIRNWARDQLK